MALSTILNWSRGVCAGVMLMAGVTLAGAAGASTEWRGGGFVTDFRNCQANGWPNGFSEPVRARYRPSGLAGNGNFSRLTFLFNNGADNFRTRQGRFASQLSEVDGVAVWSGGWVYDPHPRLRMRQHQPSNITEETDRVRLVGVIRNFNGLRGCNVNFELVLTRRPS